MPSHEKPSLTMSKEADLDKSLVFENSWTEAKSPMFFSQHGVLHDNQKNEHSLSSFCFNITYIPCSIGLGTAMNDPTEKKGTL